MGSTRPAPRPGPAARWTSTGGCEPSFRSPRGARGRRRRGRPRRHRPRRPGPVEAAPVVVPSATIASSREGGQTWDRLPDALAAATHRIFQHDRVAAGYASARPYLHPRVFAQAGEMIGGGPPRRRALDVGCGTGLSSVALLDLAAEVVGIDVARDMLRRAIHADAVSYVASGAEALPFRAGSFDLVVACGSMDWIDRPRFMPRAAELVGGGSSPSTSGTPAARPMCRASPAGTARSSRSGTRGRRRATR